MAEYSVKQLSEICGVSQTSIKKKLSQLNATKIAKRWQPTDDESIAVIRYYLGDNYQIAEDVAEVTQETQQPQDSFATTATSDKNKELPDQGNISSDLLASLNKTIEMLEKELDVKNKQIENLTKTNQQLSESVAALSASNAVQIAADKKEILLSEPKEETQETIQEITENNKKKSWWQRFKDTFK